LRGWIPVDYIDLNSKENDVPEEIKSIRLSLPYRMGTVNCYLIQTDTGYILIDTGGSNRRAELESELARAGCTPGNLKVIILTHGDFDHTGNAAHLREKFGAPIAMHAHDSGMAERGDMFWNRKSGNFLIRKVAPILFRFTRSHRFEPDLLVEEGYDLSEFGLEARVVEIPGHSKGSIGILTAGGALFSGDLLDNHDKPGLNSIMDDLTAANASVERLKRLAVHTVYRGHGRPFSLEQLTDTEE